MNLQVYDFVMLAVLVGAMLFGAWKGAVWQIAALASVIVSAIVAVHGSAPLAPYFSVQEPWNRFIAMLVLYVVVAGAIWLVFRLVSGIINRLKLKEFDRQLGVLFGLAKGILYCIVITFFAVTLWEPTRQAVLQSRSGPLIARVIRNADPIIPTDVRKWLGKYIDELESKLPPAQQEPPKGYVAPLPGASGGVGGKTQSSTRI
jgi:membrane protein required for colicin V production